MFLIGLTGGIGTGKSTISDHLRECDIPVLDSDVLAREVVEPQTACWHKIREVFGSEAISKTGEIDRAYLAEQIFNDPQKRIVLNRIIHPAIRKRMIKRIIYYFFTFRPFVVLDVPLFFEVGVYRKFCTYTFVVKSTKEQQLERIKARNGYSDDEALGRIRAQMDIDEKCKLADYVIDNTGDKAAAIQQTNDILRNLKFPLSFWLLRIGLIGFYVGLSFLVPWMIFG